MPYFVSTHSRPKAAVHIFKSPVIFVRFQHTAARRRLGADKLASNIRQVVSTHSRPKAAGFTPSSGEAETGVSTHSRPKAAGRKRRLHKLHRVVSTHSRPKAAGGTVSVAVVRDNDVSTHSRPKAAGPSSAILFTLSKVSTHSRPKAAGIDFSAAASVYGSFNTQPPEGGWLQDFTGII